MANDNITIYNGEGKPETTREMTDAEMNDRTSLTDELSILRTFRNNLLAETDYLASSDRTLSDDMKTYRQSLRDMTSGLDTIEKVKEKMKFADGKYVNFPVKPTE
jgi:hypothetical protein|tara:strand:- start:41 stop:355 length:315 start_codon:yes stop_codon:yes gene_type:complete